MARVKASWGWHVSLAAEVPDSTVINMGTTEDPVAAMQLVLAYSVRTIMQSTHFTNVYYIDGYGVMQEIAGPFSDRKVKDIGAAAPLLTDGAELFD